MIFMRICSEKSTTTRRHVCRAAQQNAGVDNRDKCRCFATGISSNSWGAEINDVQDAAYDQYALAVDRFTYEHQDFLTLFGAGNWGISMDRRYQVCLWTHCQLRRLCRLHSRSCIIHASSLTNISCPDHRNTGARQEYIDGRVVYLFRSGVLWTLDSCEQAGMKRSFCQSFEEGGKALGVAVEVTVPATVQGVSGMNEFIEADFGPELISLDSKSRYFVLVSRLAVAV